jgi:hypothetical protein
VEAGARRYPGIAPRGSPSPASVEDIPSVSHPPLPCPKSICLPSISSWLQRALELFGEICHRLRPPHSLLPSRRGGPAHIDSDQSDNCSPLPPTSKNARPFDDGDGASHRGRLTHVDGEQSKEYMAQRHLVTVQCPRTPPPPPPSPNRAHRTKPTMRCSHAPTPSSPGSSTVNSATTPASFTPSQPCASYTKSGQCRAK